VLSGCGAAAEGGVARGTEAEVGGVRGPNYKDRGRVRVRCDLGKDPLDRAPSRDLRTPQTLPRSHHLPPGNDSEITVQEKGATGNQPGTPRRT